MCKDFGKPKVLSKRKKIDCLYSLVAKFLKIIAYSLAILLSVVLVIGLYYFEHTSYGLKQLKGQMKIIIGAKPITEIIKDKNTDSLTIQKLQTIAKIKVFAKNELGIDDFGNYESYYQQQNEDVMWVVTGCKALSFEYYAYRFPIAGEFSYKGFFEKQGAENEVKRLQNEGYDAELGQAAAWSTLGILKDPILSSMLERNEAALANLIIHELTHSNIFVKNNLSFNENLADFIADKATILYLKHHYGDTSTLLHHYELQQVDEKVFHEYVMYYKQLLNEVYQSKLNDTKKRREKHRLLHAFVYGVPQLNLSFQKNYFKRAKEALLTKNAFFIDYERYSGRRNEFENDLKETKNLKKLIELYKKKYR
jgi:predicted aminopeptidase